MAYNAKYFQRHGIKGSEGSFVSGTYDAAAVGDTTADITAGTGGGYFPESVCPRFVDGTQVIGANTAPPTPMSVVLVKTANNTGGSQPAVGVFAVNVVLVETTSGSGATQVKTYNRAKTSDGKVKTRCQLMAAGQITADDTND